MAPGELPGPRAVRLGRGMERGGRAYNRGLCAQKDATVGGGRKGVCLCSREAVCVGGWGCESAGSADRGLKVQPRGSAGRGRGGEELRASPEAGLRVAGA